MSIAVPTLTGAALAPSSAAAIMAGPDPVFAVTDAELLAIGRELDPIVTEWRTAMALDRASHADFERRCEALIGPRNDSREYWKARERVIDELRSPDNGDLDCDDDGYNGHRGWSAINDDLAQLTERALALRATTREGLAVQVLAWTMDYNEVVEEYPEFFGVVCAYAGVPMPTLSRDEISAKRASEAPIAIVAPNDPPESDPIFEVIAQHKAALQEWLATEDDDESEKALDREGEVLEALFTVPPTTPAGVAAWLEYIASEHSGGDTIIYEASQYGGAGIYDVSQLRAAAAVLKGAQFSA